MCTGSLATSGWPSTYGCGWRLRVASMLHIQIALSVCPSVSFSLSLFLSLSLCLSGWPGRVQAPRPARSSLRHWNRPRSRQRAPLSTQRAPRQHALARSRWPCVRSETHARASCVLRPPMGAPCSRLGTPNFGGLLHFWTWRKNKSCCHVLISEYRPTNVLSQDSPSRSSQSFL